MKYELELTHFKKINIWIDEYPFEKINSTSYVQRKIAFNNSVIIKQTDTNHNIIVVELIQPTGARCLYGLLGIEIHRNNNKQILELKAPNETDENRFFVNASMQNLDVIKIGFFDDLQSQMLNYFQQTIEEEKIFFPGEIIMSFSAYGDLSSSLSVFQKLIKVLVFLIKNEKFNKDEIEGNLFLSYPTSK